MKKGPRANDERKEMLIKMEELTKEREALRRSVEWKKWKYSEDRKNTVVEALEEAWIKIGEQGWTEVEARINKLSEEIDSLKRVAGDPRQA